MYCHLLRCVQKQEQDQNSSQAYQACKGIVIFCGRLQHWDSAVFLTLASGFDGFGALFSMIEQMPNIVHMIL